MDEILTVNDVALLLKVADKTVYSMAQTAGIPSFKVRGQWRFRRTDIDLWISDQVKKSYQRTQDGPGELIAVPEPSSRNI